MSDTENTVRWRETNTAIEMDDYRHSTIQGESTEGGGYTKSLGVISKLLIVCTVLAAVSPMILYAIFPQIVGFDTRRVDPSFPVPSRGWASFIGSWLALAFPPAFLITALVYHLPSLSCGDNPNESSERSGRKLCGNLYFWKSKFVPVAWESMAKYWWIGLGLTVGAVMLEYALLMGFGAIASSALPSVDDTLGKNHSLANTTNPGSPQSGSIPLPLAIGTIFFMSYVVAAWVEESLKFCLALTMGCHTPKINHPHTVAILLVVGTLGFATAENYFYVFGATRQGELSTVVLTVISRFFVSVPFHASTALWISASLGPSVIHGSVTFMAYIKSIWLPVLCHGTFDFALLLAEFLMDPSHYKGSQPPQWPAALMVIPILILFIFGFFAYRKVLREVKDFQPSDVPM